MIFVKYGYCILLAQYDIMMMQFTAIKIYKMEDHEMKKKWFGKMAFILCFSSLLTGAVQIGSTANDDPVYIFSEEAIEAFNEMEQSVKNPGKQAKYL